LVSGELPGIGTLQSPHPREVSSPAPRPCRRV